MDTRQAWNELREFLEQRLEDPRHRTQISLVHAGELKQASTSFIGYPYIVLSPITITSTKKTNNGYAWKELSITISVYGTDYPLVDGLIAQLERIFTSQEDLYYLSGRGISHVMISGEELDERDIEGKPVIIKRLVLRAWIN